MAKVLTNDLDQSVLEDVNVWETIRDHRFIQSSLPIMASNTAPAKSVRVAAGLLIFGSFLREALFRPMYCVADPGLDQVLSNLEAQNPLHEACARAMLLKIDPEEQDRRRNSIVRNVVKSIRDTLVGIVPVQHQKEFEDSVAGIVAKASKDWQLVQAIQEKVSVTFKVETLDDWELLPATATSPESASKSGGSAKQKNTDRQKKQQAATAQTAKHLAKAIWPAILAPVSEDSMELLCSGVGISREDIDAAEEEGSARTNRRLQRQNTANGKQRSRRDSAIFFSSTPLDGSGGNTK